MPVVSDVIFRIGSSLGPGGLASLQAGVDMLGQLSGKIIEVAKEAEKFAQAHRKLAIDITQADSATAGLIDTYALIQNANKLSAAGVSATSEQFKNLNLVAANFAQETGEDITAWSQKITLAISKGATGPLKELGIDIKGTKSLAEFQARAFEELAKKAEGLTVEVETMSEALYVSNNNLGTSIGLLWEAAGAGTGLTGAINDVNSAWSDFNTMLEFAPEQLLDFILSVDGLSYAVKNLWNTFLEVPSWTEVFNIPYLEDVSDWFRDVQEIDTGNEETKLGLIRDQAKERMEAIRQERNMIALQKQTISNMATIMGFGQDTGPASIFEEGAIGDPSASATTKKPTGGRGKKADKLSASDELSASVDERLASLVTFSEREIEAVTGITDAYNNLISAKEGNLQVLEEREIETANVKLEQMRLLEETTWNQAAAEEAVFQARLEHNQTIFDQEFELTQLKEEQRLLLAENEAISFEDKIAYLERELALSKKKDIATQAGLKAEIVGRKMLMGVQKYGKKFTDIAIKDAITGHGLNKKAIKELTIQTGISIAQESGWRALMATAQGFMMLGQQNYGAAATSFVSAAMYGALALATGGLAAGLSRSTNQGSQAAAAGASGAPGATAGSTSDTTSGPAGGFGPGPDQPAEIGPTYVTITQNDEGTWRIIKEKNRQASINGEESFTTQI